MVGGLGGWSETRERGGGEGTEWDGRRTGGMVRDERKGRGRRNGEGWWEDWGDGQRREKGEGEKERSGMVGDPKVSRFYALNEWEFAERR